EELRLLGKVSDAEAASRLKRTLESVRSMRRKLGIPARPANWKPLPKGKGARPSLRQALWLPEEDALLGTIPDEKLARKLGRPVATVTRRRQDKHIWLEKKPWRPEDEKILGICVRRAAPEWRPEEEALLGTAPDKEIAVRLNRSAGAVHLRMIYVSSHL